MLKKKKVILMSVSSSGGHIYPALALAEKLTHLDLEIHFVYPPTSLTKKILSDSPYPCHPLSLGGMAKGQRGVQKIKTLFQLPLAFLKALLLIQKIKADLILGTGGSVTVPVLTAGFLLRKKRAIWEGNTQLGLANKFLSRFTQPVFTAFPHVEALNTQKQVWSAYPLRNSFKQTQDSHRDSSTLSDTDSSSLSDTKSNSLSDTKSNSLSDTKSNSLSDTNSSSLSDTKSNSLSDTKSNSLSDTNSSSLSDTKSNSLSDTNSSSLSDTKSNSLSDTNSSSLSDTKSNSLSDTNSSTLSEANSNNSSKVDTIQNHSKKAGFPEGKFKVFILGGSQGSVFFNKVVSEALEQEDWREDLWIYHQTGESSFDGLSKKYESFNNVSVFPFTNKIKDYYKHCDLIVARAGAGSIWESAYFSKSLVLIPLTHSAGGHQLKNASHLFKSSSVDLILEKDFNPLSFKEKILELKQNTNKRKQLGYNLNQQQNKEDKILEWIKSHIKE